MDGAATVSRVWGQAQEWWWAHGAPRLNDLVVDNSVIRVYRQRVCADLHGQVVELGFGAGLNVPFYPSAVTSVVAVEPSDLAWARAQRRVAGQRVPVTRAGLRGTRPDVPDESADCVVSCFTLCTIPDVDAALRDVVRVLRPGGTFHFLEHGLAPDASVRAWQHRLEPVHCVLFGGCRLTRPIQGLVAASDLVLDEVHTEYAPVPTFLRPWTYGYRGRAHKPTRAA